MEEIYVSLTSYEKRIHKTHLAAESLLNQSLKPTRVILWLANTCHITNELEELEEQGLLILRCEDVRSYTKLIPFLNLYPNKLVITADDDIIYNKDTVKTLYNSYIKDKNAIYACRCHEINMDHKFRYDKWKKCVKGGNKLFFTGVGCVLYPPNSFHQDVIRYDLASKICPTGDDIWFWAMAKLRGTEINNICYKSILKNIPVNEALYNLNGGIDGHNNKMLKDIYDFSIKTYNIDIFN